MSKMESNKSGITRQIPGSSKSADEGQNIKVVVRIRPSNEKELQQKASEVVNVISKSDLICKDKKYRFDRVFRDTATQLDVYEYVTHSMVLDVLNGFNCTVFAYGQTGTGKTHTMTGGNPNRSCQWTQDKFAGIIPRAAAHIFSEIESQVNIITTNVRVSFLELYCEEVIDLLVDEGAPKSSLVLQETKQGVVVNGLKEISVFSVKDVYDLIERGNIRRRTASTLMNQNSSRSHTVFTLTCHMRVIGESGEEVLRIGKLNLVDLAGSESAAKSGLGNVKESANINRSLLTLSRVIQKLAEKSVSHAPFRDSKLTRILKDSLGGHTKTCIIATISPSSTCLDETVNTLEYALQARCIKNQPAVNEKISRQELVKSLNNEIAVLRKELDVARSGEGFYVDRKNYEKLEEDTKSLNKELTSKEKRIKEIQDQLQQVTEEGKRKIDEYDSIREDWKKMANILKKVAPKSMETKKSLKQEQFISNYYEKTARETQNSVVEAFESQGVLRRKLDHEYHINQQNEKLVKGSISKITGSINEVIEKVENLSNVAKTEVNSSVDLIDNTILNECTPSFKNAMVLIESELSNIFKLTHNSLLENAAKNDQFRGEVNSMKEGILHNLTSIREKLNMLSSSEQNDNRFDYEAIFTERNESLTKVIQNETEKLILLEKLTKASVDSVKMAQDEIKMNEKLIERYKQQKQQEENDIGEVNQQIVHCQNIIKNSQDFSKESEQQSFSITTNQLHNAHTSVINKTRETLDATIQTYDQANGKLKERLCNINKALSEDCSKIRDNLAFTRGTSLDLEENFKTSQRTGDTPVGQMKRKHVVAFKEELIDNFEKEYEEDKENNLSFLNASDIAVLSSICDTSSDDNLLKACPSRRSPNDLDS